MKKICVFCGSKPGKDGKYTAGARELGQLLAKKDLGLVYGGASIGVMGAMADACLQAGGEVIGVIPQSIVDLEVEHQGLTENFVVDGMHNRKEKMYELSDAFMAIPGGMGTLDELCEIITWAQLQFHTKPIYVVNENGFYDNLMRHFRFINQEGFLSDEHLRLVIEKKTAPEAVEHFLSH